MVAAVEYSPSVTVGVVGKQFSFSPRSPAGSWGQGDRRGTSLTAAAPSGSCQLMVTANGFSFPGRGEESLSMIHVTDGENGAGGEERSSSPSPLCWGARL